MPMVVRGKDEGEIEAVRAVSDELLKEQGAGVLGTDIGEEPPRAIALKWGAVNSSDGVTLFMGRFRD